MVVSLVLLGACGQAAEPTTREPATVAGAEHVWAFDESESGAAPSDFTAAVGEWRVTEDARAASGARVLAQLGTSPGAVFNLALTEGPGGPDIDLSVRLRAISGEVDRGGGPVWRARDADNYYIARYNPLEDNFRVYAVEAGQRRQLASATVQLDQAAWHTIRVVMRGDHIECYLDGTLHLDVHDTTFPEAGQLGLWTKADAVTHFDDFTRSRARP